ncbi:hypothetical protein OG413_32245 [Streptomyces sp. NBC_01433]|uniref:hypothetical protein n=1 Tax=Streptomyces sp. NBC_01433 TaxID=2903864 RepID=UPI002255210E|nr:hypothetical protein [Streptomyces sp. NBC_01433]MCX4679898.1 hypothetical protein [Streptomyces sp. NBC_01433]
MEVSEVRDPDGLRWQVCATAVTTPPDVEPESKAAGDRTPLAVALPLGSARTGNGHVHVRLPVTPLGLPLRVHAPFDPAPSRQGLRETEWNDALVRGVADLWAAVLVERFRHGPAASWRMLPLPREVKGHDDVVGRLESTVLQRSREQVSVRLRIDVPGHGPLKLADLAVEAPELTRVLTEADIQRVAECPALPHAARDPEARYRDILEDWVDHGGAEPVDVGRGRRWRCSATRSDRWTRPSNWPPSVPPPGDCHPGCATSRGWRTTRVPDVGHRDRRTCACPPTGAAAWPRASDSPTPCTPPSSPALRPRSGCVSGCAPSTRC